MELYTCVDDQEQGGGALWSWWKVEKERNEGMNFMMTTMVYVVYFLTVLHCIFFSFVFFQNKINSYVKPLPFGKKCVVISKVGSFVKKGFHWN